MKRNDDLKKFVFMHYPDGFVIATAVWDVGQTSGPVDSEHMQALHQRAIRKGLPIVHWDF